MDKRAAEEDARLVFDLVHLFRSPFLFLRFFVRRVNLGPAAWDSQGPTRLGLRTGRLGLGTRPVFFCEMQRCYD